MDLFKDNKFTSMLLDFGVGFVAAFVLFMIIKPGDEDVQEWKLALGVGVVAVISPLVSRLLIDKF